LDYPINFSNSLQKGNYQFVKFPRPYFDSLQDVVTNDILVSSCLVSKGDTGMTIISAYKCDTGKKRPKNEDYVWVDEQAELYILADGMGGYEGGDVASHLAATTISKLMMNQLKTKPLSSEKVKEMVVNTIETANETVFKAARQTTQKRKMGTTVVVALLQSSTIYISHVGDSRAYLARDSTLTQLTEDDSWDIEFGQLKGHGQESKFKSYLTKAIGQDSAVNPSFKALKLVSGDCLLLCSDGLWGMIDDKHILAELKKVQYDPNQAVEALVNAANAAGGKDNISVIVVQVA
jgi:protein phosphatase